LSGAARVLGVGRSDNLYGDVDAGSFVGRSKDVGHPATTKEWAESIPAVEQLAGGTHSVTVN
jgi:hypothetical protein